MEAYSVVLGLGSLLQVVGALGSLIGVGLSETGSVLDGFKDLLDQLISLQG
jgi:hypothetical protein